MGECHSCPSTWLGSSHCSWYVNGFFIRVVLLSVVYCNRRRPGRRTWSRRKIFGSHFIPLLEQIFLKKKHKLLASEWFDAIVQLYIMGPNFLPERMFTEVINFFMICLNADWLRDGKTIFFIVFLTKNERKKRRTKSYASQSMHKKRWHRFLIAFFNIQ